MKKAIGIVGCLGLLAVSFAIDLRGDYTTSTSIAIHLPNHVVTNDYSTARIGRLSYNTNYSVSGTEPTGSVYWNSVDGTLDTVLGGAILQNGQELYFYGKASEGIANGELCQFAGVQGDHILIKKVVTADIVDHPEYIVGVATQHIPTGSFGYVTWFGKVNNVYTTGWSVGDLLFYDNQTGQLTNIRPSAPDRTIIVAAVIKEATGAAENGIIIVRPTLGAKITDLNDVNGTPLTETKQMMVWNNTANYFDFTEVYGRFGDYASGNYSMFEDDGTLIATGDATTWKDIFIVPITSARSTGVGALALVTITGNIQAYSMAIGDSVMINNEFNHEWKIGTEVEFHIHILNRTDVAATRNVQYVLEYSFADYLENAQPPSVLSVNFTIPPNTPVGKYYIVDFGRVVPNINKVSGMFFCKLLRATAIGTDPADDPIVLNLGCHGQIDSFGSRQEYVK